MNIKNYNNHELATAYVPFQYYTDSFTPAEALKKGTLFPELYKPHLSRKGKR